MPGVCVRIYIYRYKKLWLSTSMYYSLFATRVFACSAVPVGRVCLSLERSQSLKIKIAIYTSILPLYYRYGDIIIRNPHVRECLLWRGL